ncbi:hypothetical protein ACSBR2_029232 [Camellia fascicularis]
MPHFFGMIIGILWALFGINLKLELCMTLAFRGKLKSVILLVVILGSGLSLILGKLESLYL